MQTAQTLRFGPVSMVHPAAAMDFAPIDWSTIETAAIWLGQGLKQRADDLMAAMEDRLGVTIADRRFARLQRVAAEWKEPVLTEGMQQRIVYAEQSMQLGNKRAKVRGRKALETVRRDHVAYADHRSLERHLAQVEVLEAGRGVTVGQEPSGALRIKRDGLEGLLMSGALSPPEYAAGMRYRTWIETTQESLGSQMGERTPGSGGIDIDGEQRHQAKVTDARAAILAAEAVVKHGTNGRRIMTLHQVAGLGRTIASLGGGGATRARNTAALQIALQMLADKWGLQ